MIIIIFTIMMIFGGDVNDDIMTDVDIANTNNDNYYYDDDDDDNIGDTDAEDDGA